MNNSPTNRIGYFKVYIDQVKETSLKEAFEAQKEVLTDFLPSISEEQSKFAYAEGKWTLKEMLQHIIDAERIFTYRALCFARRETGALPSFDENEYAAASGGNLRSWQSLVEEFVALRRSTEYLYGSFSDEMLALTGKAGSNVLSASELGFILLGHFNHHKKIMQERYLKD